MDIPSDASEQLGNLVEMTHYVDANVMHNIFTGHSFTGILHLLNQASTV